MCEDDVMHDPQTITEQARRYRWWKENPNASLQQSTKPSSLDKWRIVNVTDPWCYTDWFETADEAVDCAMKTQLFKLWRPRLSQAYAEHAARSAVSS